MALQKENCEILLSQKLNGKNHWEFRLSIREKILGTKKEVLFAKGELEKDFMFNLEQKLLNHNLKNYTRIQRISRFSRTLNRILWGEKDMKKVPDYIFEKVRRILLEYRTKAITIKKSGLVKNEEPVLA